MYIGHGWRSNPILGTHLFYWSPLVLCLTRAAAGNNYTEHWLVENKFASLRTKTELGKWQDVSERFNKQLGTIVVYSFPLECEQIAFTRLTCSIKIMVERKGRSGYINYRLLFICISFGFNCAFDTTIFAFWLSYWQRKVISSAPVIFI